MRTRRSSLVQLALFAGVVLVAGCSNAPTSPGSQPEVANSPDHFSYQVTGMRNYSAAPSYSWQNSGAQATVNQACSVGAGSASLVILDGAGTQVYSRSLAENGTFTSASGVAGTWTIRIVYSDASATVNFRADKTT